MQSIVERYNRQKTEVIVKDYPNFNSYNCKHNRNRQIFEMPKFLALRTYQYFLLLKRDDSLASAKSLGDSNFICCIYQVLKSSHSFLLFKRTHPYIGLSPKHSKRRV
jgi:hypothetical protein